MNLKKRLMKAVSALVLLLAAMTAPVHAANASFVDVPLDSPYAEYIQYVADRGISCGTGGHLFSPDKTLTARQWAVMLCRAKGLEVDDVIGTSFGDAAIKAAYDGHWIGVEGLLQPDTPVCRSSLYRSAFRAYEIQVYDASLFGMKDLISDENNLRTAKEIGLAQQSEASTEQATRADAAKVIFMLETHEYHTQPPPIASEVVIENNDGLDLNGFLHRIALIPEPIRTHFNRSGWRYVIDCTAVNQYAEILDVNCIGVCDYSKKTIFVSESSATVHEFGHFLHKTIRFPTVFKQIFNDESRSMLPLLREYSMTNEHEYFADCFVYWIKNQDNEEGMKRFRQIAPKTYTFFSVLSTNAWDAQVT